MDQPLFVGREAELAQLHALLTQGAQGRGGIVFLEGEAGLGKSKLLEMVQAQASQRPELEKARFVSGYCYEGTGTQNAYQPFIEILDALAKTGRKGSDIAKLVLTIVKETGPDWLQMIPVIGAAVGAGLKTATLAGQWFLKTPNEKESDAAALASQYVNMIVKIASRYNPLALIIEDAHWIDETSCRLLLRLARRVRENPLVILLTYRPSYLPESHPLKNIQRELYAQNLARVIPLAGLPDDQIRHYLQARFGSSINPHLVAWLAHLCNGNPLFVSQYLNLLEQSHIIRPQDDNYILDGEIGYADGEWALSDNIPIPDTIEAVLDQRIQRLIETDQKMLQQASIQGERFMSTILSELLEVKELELLPRLRKVVEEHRLIRYGSGTDDWTEAKSEVYAFEHALMHRAFYQKLSPREQVLYHRRVAELLERSLKDDANPPRKLVIEVAHHYDLGNEPKLAAHYYWLAAQSSLANGAFVETIQLCRRALDKVRHLREGVVENDRLRAEVIQLLLLGSEIRWRGKPEQQGKLPLEKLAEEAETAALRTGDLALIAQVKFLRGQAILVMKNYPEAVKAMQEALEIARQAGDPLIEFIIMSRLGHDTAVENLAAAVAMLSQAHDLYESRLRTSLPPGIKPAMLAQAFHRLQSLLGVGKFDQGNYGEAIQWLTSSVAGLKQLKMRDYLLAPYNFLAQVYIASGLFEDAEAALLEAFELFKDEKEPNAWNAYNQALFGKLYLEWNRVEDAADPLSRGWEQTQTTWNVSMVPLVRNYYAELLMHPDYSGRNLGEAERLLIETVNESKQTGTHRSAIAALSLLSQLFLLQGRVEGAVDYSTQALEYLEKMGMAMPALRTEEVLLNHFRALKAAGRESEARDYLEQANEVIQQKASTLRNEEHRRSFLERIAVNRAILSAMN